MPMIERLNAASGKIHLIADVRDLKKGPSIREIVDTRHPRHPKLGQVLTIGLTRNVIGRFFFTWGAQVAGFQYKDFDSLEKARAYLHEAEGV